MEERLFEVSEDRTGSRTPVPPEDQPLAVRMRPASLDEFVGQEHLLGRGSALRTAIEDGRAALDDPLRAAGHGQDHAGAHRRRRRRGRLRGGVRRRAPAGPRCAAVIERARATGARTRRADDLLPRRDPPLQQGPAGRAAAGGRGGARDADRRDHREPLLRGQLGAALALPQVYELHALDAERRRGAAAPRARATERGIATADGRPTTRSSSCAARSGGDARTALCALELACETAGRATARSTLDAAEDALQRKALLYDKGGDRHYDYISAWIKATRGSDPDASLYYLAVMLEGGEDPRFIARRMVILASEDIGNADPQALVVAVGGRRAVEHVGHARVPAQPRPGRDLPRARAEVERRPPRRSARAREHVREHGAPAPAGRTCATPPTRAPRSSAAARATTTRTTSPRASPTRSCCPTRLVGDALLRARPRRRRRCASAWSASGAAAGAKDRAGPRR